MNAQTSTHKALDFPVRVLVTKIGLDGHDRGSRIVAAYLRDAGMEVIYTPPWQEVEAVATLALQEDVDVIGLSSLATDHLIVPDLMERLREVGMGHVKVVVGGIVPESEHGLLAEAGVSRIFQPGARRDDIVDCVSQLAAQARFDADDLAEV
ncbi:MAG TPA: cobalamin-dependent protein [Xanthomonadales bacterium]|nr:cobalamin-dependent protein [Xanthomonadales bacterium]